VPYVDCALSNIEHDKRRITLKRPHTIARPNLALLIFGMVPPRIPERGVTLHAEYYEAVARFVPSKGGM
jgi:hypothetical protein